jgi:hypothetical protein
MAQPQMPHIPGAAVMNDTLDFVKNLWGSMGVPGLTTPTLSVDELDKKINDLKAVEAWLNLNMNMLRGSIQALEVQRNTIATLKSVGASLAAAVNQSTAQSTAPGAAAGEHKSIFDANPYTSAFFQHAREADAPKPAAPPPPPQPKAAEPKPADAAPQADAKADATAGASALWWNLLQDQFKQAVSTAVASESMMADAAARAAETAVKFATATAVKPEPAGAGEPAAAAADASAPAAAAGQPATGSTAPADRKPAAKRAPVKPPKPASGK